MILVYLPMTKDAFYAVETEYINSVAFTANTDPRNVKVLNVIEISTSSSMNRLLLSVSVQIQTSILIQLVHLRSIEDNDLLNRNLNKNGLPNGTIVVQSVTQNSNPSPASNINLPSAPSPNTSLSSERNEIPTSSSSGLPIGIIIGGAAGAVLLVVISFLLYRRKRMTALASVS